MKRSMSMLVTALLFSAAIAPNAMAHMQNPHALIASSIRSTVMPEQPASDSTEPTSPKTPKTEIPPAPTTAAPASITTNLEKSRPNIDRSNVDPSYPAYCPSLPPGTKPGDWEYREALQNCLYGT